MNVLIVQGNEDLGNLWQRHLERQGMSVSRAADQKSAIAFLSENTVQVIVLDLVLKSGAALAVADYANYRQPETRVIFVTNTTFFSDGSIFAHAANACAFLPSTTPPEDLAAMIEHHAGTDA
jgi:DNA-binding NtrC family response regulator